MQTRTQKMANSAILKVKAVTEGKDEYKRQAENFPVLVMQAGLAQALGFLRAKKKETLLNDLAVVLHEAGVGTPATGDALQAHVLAVEVGEYRRLTREVLAAAGWFKRFAQAEL